MCVCVCVCVCVYYIYIYIYYIYIYIYTCIPIHMYIHIYIYIYICMYAIQVTSALENRSGGVESRGRWSISGLLGAFTVGAAAGLVTAPFQTMNAVMKVRSEICSQDSRIWTFDQRQKKGGLTRRTPLLSRNSSDK
jgi:hypothetical protein